MPRTVPNTECPGPRHQQCQCREALRHRRQTIISKPAEKENLREKKTPKQIKLLPQEKSAKEKTSAKTRPDKLKQPEGHPLELGLCRVLGPRPAPAVSSPPVATWSSLNSLATPVGSPPLLPLQPLLSCLSGNPSFPTQLSRHVQYRMSDPSVTSAPSFLLTSFLSYLDQWETCWQCPPPPPPPPPCLANGRGGLCERLHPYPRPFFP